MCVLCFLFFFFKQKTAYERRISDWSSDVCSSDLLRDDTVTIRPIAGTRPRGATPAEDRTLAEDLLSDPKELAEHLMLLDLGRNDVGRVAAVGSVKVTEKNAIELYSHVMHIVSKDRKSTRLNSSQSCASRMP